MSKKSGKLSKKRTLIIIITSAVAILLLGGGAYYLYSQNQARQADSSRQKEVVSDERKKLDETSFRGNRDLAAQYIEATKSNDRDAAYQLYEEAINKLDDDAEKKALYEQAVTIALDSKQSDQAVRFAIALSELSNTHRTSANVADIYGMNGDVVKQKEYLQKAIDQLEVLPKDSEEYRTFKSYYGEVLAKLGVN